MNTNWHLKTLSKGGGFLQQARGDITTLTAKMFCPKISFRSLRPLAKSTSWEFLAEHIRIFEVRMTHAAGSDWLTNFTSAACWLCKQRRYKGKTPFKVKTPEIAV